MISNVVDSIDSPPTTGRPIPQAVLKADALLAYVYGNSWHTYGPYAAARPDLAAKGWIVTVTLSCLGRARMYDIEPGGGENRNIGYFMAHNADRAHGLPILYTFAANGAAMLAAASGFGYHQGRDFLYLSSHVGKGPHICAPNVCGYPAADGTQYQFAGNVDYSQLNDYMLPGRPPPAPPPAPPPPGPEHAQGVFNAAVSYDHDARSVTAHGTPGDVKRWGQVNERIRLELDLEVGDTNPRKGEWSGRVLGSEGP